MHRLVGHLDEHLVLPPDVAAAILVAARGVVNHSPSAPLRRMPPKAPGGIRLGSRHCGDPRDFHLRSLLPPFAPAPAPATGGSLRSLRGTRLIRAISSRERRSGCWRTPHQWCCQRGPFRAHWPPTPRSCGYGSSVGRAGGRVRATRFPHPQVGISNRYRPVATAWWWPRTAAALHVTFAAQAASGMCSPALPP